MRVGPQTLHRTEKLVINQDMPHGPFDDAIEAVVCWKKRNIQLENFP